MFSKTLRHLLFATRNRKMSVYTQSINRLTGKSVWEIQNENYDYHQEVARSSYADMLHDTERNQLYYKAIQIAISEMKSKGKKANVLDVGTGTGLLSMMAAKCGANSIVACEAFTAMSKCAVEIISLNGFSDKITVIPKRSTEITVGPGGDMEQKANILVTEVFDTELIGESALHTFSHAHECLLEKDCIVVPHCATLYAQIVESPIGLNWHRLKDIYDEDCENVLLKVPKVINDCAGSAIVHDLQLSQVPLHFFNTIVSPQAVLKFDWSGRTPFVFKRSNVLTLKAERSGRAQLVFVWWDLNMDVDNKYILSCAPYWAHPSKETSADKLPWRDHWMQAIYFFPKDIHVTRGKEVHLISCHDDYSLWFNLKSDLNLVDSDYSQPICQCNLHIAYARTRIGQLNDSRRTKKYISVLTNHITSQSVVLVLSHGFYHSLTATKLGARKILMLENNSISKSVVNSFINYNNLTNVEVFDNLSDLKESNSLKEVNLVIGEPYFISSILPWDNLLFAYLLKDLVPLLTPNTDILPRYATIKAIAVNFVDLYKISTPLMICEGFSMTPFDNLIEKSRSISDDNVEAQPLWEYPGIAVSQEIPLSSFSIQKLIEDESVIEENGTIQMEDNNTCNGIAIWMDWNLDGKSSVNNGPITPPQVGQKIEWDMYSRQGVCLFQTDKKHSVKFNIKFDISDGKFRFKFD